MLTTNIELDTANVEALLARLLALKSEPRPDDGRIGGASAELADAITGLARAVAATGPRRKGRPLPPRVEQLVGQGVPQTFEAFQCYCSDLDCDDCPYHTYGTVNECLLAWLTDEGTNERTNEEAGHDE